MSCTPTDVTLLGTSQCTASVINLSSTLVNWSVSGTNTGTITAGGLYTAPAAIPNTTSNVVTITATSQVQSTLTATQSLTLLPPTAIANVTCIDKNLVVAATVSSGNQISCSATASTGALVPVNWSVSNKNNAGVTTNLGSISSQGIYTAALVPPPGQVVTITATSQALASETLTATVNVVYGNAALSGSYVFSTTGRLPTHAYWARTGSFTLGGGSLSGIEDVNQGGTPNLVTTQRSFTGSYSIGPDGRGTMQFCEGTSAACPLGSAATAYFNIAVFSTSQPSVNQAEMIEFSAPGSTSAFTIAGGEMVSQSQSVFNAGAGNLSGTYSFDFAGISAAGSTQSNVGDFVANGHGSIAIGSITPGTVPGEIDTNVVGSTPTQAAVAATSYAVSANGRGTMTLNGLTFSFYPISSNRAKFIEIDTPTLPATSASILQGDAFIQQTSSTCGWGLSALNGLAVYETTGSSAAGVIGDVGSFMASSNGSTGTIGAASIDENNAGTVASAVGTLTGAYTLDACGRGTLSVGAHTYVFYVISSSNAVLQETTSGVSAHGLLLPSQGGPFVDATLTGSYAFRLGGTDAAGGSANREDFLGQLTSAGTGTGLTGTLDLNDFGTTQTPVAIIGGTYPPPAAGIRETLMLPLSTTPASTRNLVFYMVSPTLFYVLDTDATGTALGVIDKQF